MQRNFDILQHEKIRQDEENKQLKERLERLETQLEENTNSDFNFDSQNSDTDNDVTYDTEIGNSDDDINEN